MERPETTNASSPKILSLEWGRMEIEGLGAGRDFKLWPGGGRQWDWRETGTHHSPGIQPGDVAELLEHGSRHVVLSKGQLSRLGTCAETMELLHEAGVTVHVQPTPQAIETYNRLADRYPVGGLFHSTC
jgi:hypothetical protein